jgi:hypothetical protein
MDFDAYLDACASERAVRRKPCMLTRADLESDPRWQRAWQLLAEHHDSESKTHVYVVQETRTRVRSTSQRPYRIVARTTPNTPLVVLGSFWHNDAAVHLARWVECAPVRWVRPQMMRRLVSFVLYQDAHDLPDCFFRDTYLGYSQQSARARCSSTTSASKASRMQASGS